MLTIVTNTLLGLTIIAVIYMAVHIVGIVGSINDLYRQLARHQKDVNELLKANNPQAYYDYKVKNENRIRKEMGIPVQPTPDTHDCIKKEKK